MFTLFRQSSRLLLAACSSVLLAALLTAAETPPVRDYSPSDATADILAKYRVSLDAKNYDEAIGILDAQIAKAEAGSYDLAILYQYKASTLLQKGDFTNSIEPLEKGLILSDAKTPTYYDERITRELLNYLAQLYFQEAAQSKNLTTAGVQFAKADKYMARWMKESKKPTYDTQYFYASLLYTWALHQNPDHPDLELIKRALEQAELALHLAIHPKDTVYVLKLACLQQLGRNAEATEYLELLIRQKPDSANYWQQLASLYLSAEQSTRAIITFERAQANGLMNSPKDNFNLIGIYFNIGQYEKAAELLEYDLKNGKIESEMKNWELLAFSYQQLERPLKGIEALKQATKAFPKSGQLEYMIAQAYHALDQPEAALPHAQAAVAKGSDLTKPHQAYLFLSYIAYGLKKYDIALEAAKKTAEYPEGVKDGQNMVRAIEDVLKDREAKKNKM